MSIETRAVTLSRSFRTLIWKARGASKFIKDLKDLSVLRRNVFYRHAGPKGPEEKKDVFSATKKTLTKNLHFC